MNTPHPSMVPHRTGLARGIATAAWLSVALRLQAASFNGGPNDGWVFGECAPTVLGGSGVTLTSTDRVYTRGDGPSPAPLLTIADDQTVPGIKTATGLRLTIPASLPLTWDTNVTLLTLGGSAASRVTTAATYTNGARTLVLEVTEDFLPGDTLTLADLGFAGFMSAGLGSLSLDIDRDGRADTTDPAVYRIVDRGMNGGPDDGTCAARLAAGTGMGGSVVTLVSTDAFYARGSLPTPTPTLSITEDAHTPGIKAGTDIRLAVPKGLLLTWDPTVTTLSFGGSAAGKVSAFPAYEQSARVLVIDVATDFAAGDTLTITGATFANFIGASVGSLTLDYGNDGIADATDTALQHVLDRGMSGGPDDGTASAVTRQARHLSLEGLIMVLW